jgi:hypothetical protein
MLLEKLVCNRDIFSIPPGVARLIAAQQKEGRPPGVESEQDAIRPTPMLNSEFLHI